MFQITFLIFIYIFNVCCYSQEEAWYSYQKEFQNGNREELVIKNVKSEDNIHVSHNVSKWKSISLGSICYSIGVSSSGIVKLASTLNSEGTSFNVSKKFFELNDEPLDVVLFSHLLHDEPEVIAIVIYQNERKIDWLLLSREMEIQTFWTAESKLYHVNVFKHNDRFLLAMIDREEQNASLTVYNMNLENQDIQLSPLTSIDIPEIARSSAFIHTNEIDYFAVPQTQSGKVVIYKIVNDTFIEHETIKSSEVTEVTSFSISFRFFLTVNGHNSGIYEFTEHGITRQNLVHGNMDSIHFWLPVPVQTYRDEVILLAERALEHDTHTSCTVEIIVNNGGKFEEHEDIPCTHVGENVDWLTCLSHDLDIAGSNYILVEDKLGIIVPQENENFSEIFMIEYEIVIMPHPKERELQKIVALKKKLQQMIELQQKRMEELKKSKQATILRNAKIQSGEQRVTSMNHAQLFDLRSQLEDIGSKLKMIKEKMNDTLRVNSTYDTIIINNRAEFKGNVVVETLNFQSNSGEVINHLLNDIVNKNNLTKIPGKKTFTDLEVKNITFQKLNNIEAENIILSNGSPITLTGTATFKQPLEVQNVNILNNRIKDISLDDIVVLQENYNGELKFANISVTDTFSVDKLHGGNNPEFRSKIELESLFLPENATVKFINEKSLDDLINDMCLINVKCYIPKNLTVQGNITTEESFTDFLNDLKFPENFLFVDSSSHANITGKKIFKNSLKAEEITTQGTVDNVDFSRIITLSTDQEIPGKIIFEQLQLTEILNVTGNVTGDDMDKFLPNPTLNETDIVHSNVIFNRLEVEGDIIIENYFNNQPFNETLSDLVYKENENVDISGIKNFPNGIEVEDLIIKSGMINNIKLEDLVTKHKDENLFNISHLKGDVTIKNLFVNGTFNGFNITELDESLVKLTGEQFIESTLIFNDELTVQNLEISEKLNDHKFDDYLYATGDHNIDWDVSFETLNAENVSIEGNFTGKILDNNVTMLSPDRYLSYTKDQTIDVPFEIRLSEVENLEATMLNDFEILNANRLNKDLAERISKGLIAVENLEVTGSLKINEANGQIMEDLFDKYPIRIDKLKKNLTVEGDVYFKEVTIKKLSNVSWETLLKLLVFKNETNLKLNGTKTFQNDFFVKKLVETNKINNISLENIFTTKGKQDIRGPISIVGNVTFQKLVVKERVNDVDVNDIVDNLEIFNDTYTIKSDVLFQRLAYIDDLNLKGNINKKNPEDTLNQIVFLDEDFVLKKPMTFHNPIKVSGNISIQNFNGDVFPDFSNFVFVDDPAIITGRVTFNEPVLLSEKLLIVENLNTTLLSGLNTTDWLEKAVFVNKGLLTGNYGFENITINENLIVKILNHQNMSSVIDLRVGQFINHMKFGEIKAINNIPVGNLVNGYKLAEELNNTLMANGNQTVNSNIIFTSPILVRENLSVETLNKHDASRIVTTNKNQNLSSPFNFKSKCSVSSDFKVYGLLNGVSTAQLNKNLKSFSSDVQEVENDWNVLKNVTFTDVVESDDIIENLNLTYLAAEVEERTTYKYQTEGEIIETYNALCTDIKHLQKAAQNQLYRFRYFDSLQEMSFNENLRNLFSFEFSGNKYLLINEDGCLSHTFIFNSTMFYPLEFGIVTGQIDQIVPVKRKNKKYLVTRSTSDECLVRGTNIWELIENTLKLKYKMEDLELIQDSLVPGTFYGLDSEGVTEYKINDVEYRKYRQWKISEENLAFFPRGLSGTGLALRTGDKIIFLQRTDAAVDEEDLDINTHRILRGSFQLRPNTAVPGRSGMNIEILHVGTEGSKKTFLAVTNHERTTVGGHTNIIKIYDNPLTDGVFQEIPSYKPSSLVSIEFEQGETLLAFLEDNKILQIYEYKGIEGFKHRSTIKMPGTKLVPMTLQITPYLNPRKALGVLDGNKVKIIQAVMLGNRLEENFDCEL